LIAQLDIGNRDGEISENGDAIEDGEVSGDGDVFEDEDVSESDS